MPSNDDYIIAFDEQGRPYIAHSIFSNLRNRFLQNQSNAGNKSQQRSPRQNHKYILRIDDNGRRRYFYTREEIQAYYKAKQGGSASVAEKNQNGSSLQNAAKNAVSLAKTQTARMQADYRKMAEDTKNAVNSTNASGSGSKPYTGVADYARQRAAEANTPKSTYMPPEEDESTSKKSSKNSSSGSSTGNSGTTRAAAQQSNTSAMLSEIYQQLQQLRNAQAAKEEQAANSANVPNEETEYTIAKAANQLEGADKYDEYKKAAEIYKSNPTQENAERRDKLRQEWISTSHGKFVTSVSNSLATRKQEKAKVLSAQQAQAQNQARVSTQTGNSALASYYEQLRKPYRR